MAEVIRMPKMSDTMEEGVIAAWHKKKGEKVESGDILAEVETDKATMELESYNDGTLLHIEVGEQESVPVNGVIAIIGEEDEDIESLLKEIKENGQSEDASDTAAGEKQEAQAEEQVDASDINATVITMPKMSDTMEEGTIAAWHKKEGDEVSSGDILAEVETDKATMELESYNDGVLLYIGVKEGDAVPVDDVIAVIGEKGADVETLLKAHRQEQAADKETEAPAEPKEHADAPARTDKEESRKTEAAPPATSDTTTSGGRIKASPLAKKLAEEKGYNIADIPGSGDGGRIIKRDVENYVPKPQAPREEKEEAPSYSIPQVVGEESSEETKVSQMRKTIARRLSESKFGAPHFYLTMEMDMDRVVDARKNLNEISPVKISFNDIIIKAVSAALRQHPKINASWQGDTISYHKHIHIGVAVAVDEGLLVPVLKFADNKSLAHISAEIKELGAKARDKKLQPDEMEGNTFTISNLGMFGIEEFTAIINPPESCILAVGGIKQTPVVKDGEIVPGNVMKVTMSCDHRVVDGATGAAFLKTLKELLQDPIRILI